MYSYYAVRFGVTQGFPSIDAVIRYVERRADAGELWTVGRRIGRRVVRL